MLASRSGTRSNAARAATEAAQAAQLPSLAFQPPSLLQAASGWRSMASTGGGLGGMPSSEPPKDEGITPSAAPDITPSQG